jgi:hypothetical protein
MSDTFNGFPRDAFWIVPSAHCGDVEVVGLFAVGLGSVSHQNCFGSGFCSGHTMFSVSPS